MWERTLSQKLVRLFCEQKVIDEAKADAYVYGYELLISSVVSILLVILIAAVCGDVRYALSFLIGFIPQRMGSAWAFNFVLDSSCCSSYSMKESKVITQSSVRSQYFLFQQYSSSFSICMVHIYLPRSIHLKGKI